MSKFKFEDEELQDRRNFMSNNSRAVKILKVDLSTVEKCLEALGMIQNERNELTARQCSSTLRETSENRPGNIEM